MATSAAQKIVPLAIQTGGTSVQFAISSSPVSTDIAKPVAPDRKRELAGLQAELDLAFAQVMSEKQRAVLHAAASGQHAANSDMADLSIEMISAYLQGGDAKLRALGIGIEAVSMGLEIYADRVRAKEINGIRPEKIQAQVQVETLRDVWRNADNLQIKVPELAANEEQFDADLDLDLEAALEEQARALIMTPSDPNTQALHGADRQIDERMTGVLLREKVLPPGVSSIHQAYTDPDFVHQYHEKFDQRPAFRISGLG